MRYYPVPESSIQMPDVIKAVRMAFWDHGNGNFKMPPKSYVPLPGGDFRTMPSYLPSLKTAGVKVVNVHPDNRVQGLPTVMGTIILLDPPTGRPVAILNATGLTDLRTGAAAAVATSALAPVKQGTLGMIGAGRQARSGLLAIKEVFGIESVRVWSRSLKTSEHLVVEFPALDITVTSPGHAADSDVLLTTTPSIKPVVMNDWISDGTHINAIGADAPGKQELESILLKRAEVFVDDLEQAIHSGEINVPISSGLLCPDTIRGTLGEVLVGKIQRRSRETVTIFDSTGIAITDLAVASEAVKQGSFIELPFPTG
ncbi:MAG TPA: ornithine cyclodeaminase family protein [Methanospirillum sp.]|uniref:ornithine cyclodeaminase family protein n=1 Tax=Methanospirillum sp. TaxID=45200 RepID=UPI002CA67E87|nr:ornithine cyclodeaminase family protein [Methanospirillum sp.]HWQ65074.1 ornithine cyclodeaminase family protein [Methanospirillum sp.]